MDDQPLLTFALPEEDLRVIVVHRISGLRKDRGYISVLQIQQLKQIISLHNTTHDLSRRDKGYIPLSGRKSELVERVSNILYKETEEPTRRSLNGISSRSLPSNSPPDKPPAKKRKIVHKPNAIVSSFETQWQDCWETERVDFNHCQSPFWKEEVQLEVKPVDPPRGYKGKYPTYEIEGNFTLTFDQMVEVHKGDKSIHFRLYNKHERRDVEWLGVYELQVNYSPASLTRKKLRTAPVQNPNPFIIRSSPVFEKVIFKETNHYRFRCPSTLSGYLVIQLVSPVTMETIIKNAPNIFGKGMKSGDDDLAEVSLKVGIRCPLSFTRIEVPAKGVYCTHVQCFDFESYLYFCKQQSIWYCPICYKSLPPDQLRKDGYFVKILDYVGDEDSDDDIKVEINDDGTFQKMSLVVPPEEAPEVKAPITKNQSDPLRKSGSGSMGFISLLDSDSENEAPPSPPIRATPPSRTHFPIITLSDSEDE